MATERIPGISNTLIHEEGSVTYHNDGTIPAMSLENPEHVNEHAFKES